MKFILPNKDDLSNESDVEQKLVMPILTLEQPLGLGIPREKIHTKTNIRTLAIGKGKKSKRYFPDYLVIESGFPVLLIEAKAPDQLLLEAFREARLYAAELNAIFPCGANPLHKIIVTNGITLQAGNWDHAQPKFTVRCSQLEPHSEAMAKLQDFCSYQRLIGEAARSAKTLVSEKQFKPRRLVGGAARQQEEIGHNTFGSTVAAEFSHIFNPLTQADKKNIAQNGYIPSRRRERYVNPIDRVIRAARPPSEVTPRTIDDTSTPHELLKALKNLKPLEHQVLLLVGGVGVGKSTFVDVLQYTALPLNIRNTTLWLRIDMNAAPVAAGEIYDWLRAQIISECQRAYPDVDFEELDAIKSVFSVEINKFNKGAGKLYSKNSATYNEKLADKILEVSENLHLSAVAYTRYCGTERGKLPIVVLDNCDKRTRDQQLLLFEVAQWVQKEFRSLVVLPLREETYDNYRDQPPLDTALKDLVFRIEPPLFHNVLVKRVQMAFNEINAAGEKTFRYELPNGFHVDYPASDKAFFLKAMISAVFDYDIYIRRMILGLSGRNIRRALEIFSEFCTSGHIGEDQIFRVIQSKGTYLPPLDVVMRVILRGNRRFYDTDYSYVKNILAKDPRDGHPSYFTRLAVLRWLRKRYHLKGTTAFKGYFQIQAIANDLERYGIEGSIVLREVEYLAKAHCLIAEDFCMEGLSIEHHVRLAPAGFVQIELLSSSDFAAALAEDTWFDNRGAAERVRDRIKAVEKHYTASTALGNARELLNQLKTARERDLAAIDAVFESHEFADLTDLSDMENSIARLESDIVPTKWRGIAERLPAEKLVDGTIANVVHFGVFVELEIGLSGLIHSSRLPRDFQTRDEFSIGERVVVQVINADYETQRIDLKFVSNSSETDATDMPIEQ